MAQAGNDHRGQQYGTRLSAALHHDPVDVRSIPWHRYTGDRDSPGNRFPFLSATPAWQHADGGRAYLEHVVFVCAVYVLLASGSISAHSDTRVKSRRLFTRDLSPSP